MRLHRFYIDPSTAALSHDFWLKDVRIVPQLLKVLRYRTGQQIILFDGKSQEALYEITEIDKEAIHVIHKTDFRTRTPARDVYLFWTMLKNDKNDLVLQKCTELGVNHFVPLITERSERKDINAERSQKIIIEAAEQCGRSNIPQLREPITLEAAIDQFNGNIQLFIADQDDSEELVLDARQAGVFIGPEGGWSESEKQLFESSDITKMGLGDFTLRAETACIVAASKLL